MLRRSCTIGAACSHRVVLAVQPTRLVNGKRFMSVMSAPRAYALRTQTAPTINFNATARRYASYPSHQKLGMPALSPTMTAGNIIKWHKKVGDQVKVGDAIAEIETDKAALPLEATEDGYLAKILVEEGAKDVSVNTIIAIIADKKDDAGKFGDYKFEDSKKPAAAAAPAAKSSPPPSSSSKPSSSSSSSSSSSKPASSAPQSQKPSKSYPPHIKVGLPSLSPSMETGSINEWTKKEGDKISQGDVIAKIETDKSTIDFESNDDGFLAKILKPAGSKDVPVQATIAVIVAKKEDIVAFKDYSGESAAPKAAEPQQEQKPQETKKQSTEAPQQKQQQSTNQAGGRIFASPLAKAFGRENNVDLSQISGTGPSNRIIKEDVVDFIAAKGTAKEEARAEPEQKTKEAPKAAAAAPSTGSYTDIAVSNIRKVTAERLLQSKQTIPHYYLTMEVRVDKLLKLRAELNDQANGKYKLSVNDFIVKASASALQKVPVVNSSWNEKFIRRYNNIDINVAVNTDQGLFTPIVKDADKRGLGDIANAVKVLADKAKTGKLAPAEFQGGTFTISNLGMFGIKHFAAVINPPQAAILAVGGASQRIVPAAQGGDATEVATILTVTLSCDHRVVDGAVGAEWLQAFKDVMENPIKLLL